MADQLRNVGLSYQSDNVNLFAAIRPADSGGFATIGARGCFMSHLSILEDAFKRNYKTILIIEDDCNFTSDCVARLQALEESHLSKNWDILYGGTLSGKIFDNNTKGFEYVASEQPLMGSHFISIKGNVLPELINYFKAMLERPVGHIDGGPMHVDGAYSWFRYAHPQYKTLLSVPHLAYQRSSRTDIHPNQWYDRLPFFKGIVVSIRKFKNRFLNKS